MPVFTPIQSRFIAGEISPQFEGQTDIPQYYHGCRTLENWIVRTSGGIMKRPGFYYSANTKAEGAARLIPFVYIDVSYVLEVGDAYTRVYKDDGTQVSGPYEVGGDTQTWAASDLFEIDFCQDGAEMFLTHPDHPAMKLTYTSESSWAYEIKATAGTPFTAGVGDEDFDAADHYPAACAFFEKRLLFAYTTANPNRSWGSKVADYEDFTTGSAAADAWDYKIEGGPKLRWIVPKDDIFYGAHDREIRLTGQGALITPANDQNVARGLSPYGSAVHKAQLLGDVIAFVTKSKKMVRGMRWIEDQQAWFAEDLTYWSDHILGSGIKQWALQTSPNMILWCVTTDGELAALSYEKGFGVTAWHRHVTDGTFESVAVIPGTAEDQLWVIVNRTVNGSTTRTVEYMKPWDWGTDQADYFFVDSGLSVDQGDSSTITGISQADPGVVTAVAHGLSNDDLVRITDVVGMTEVNTELAEAYMVKNKTADTFELYLTDGTTTLDTSGFTAWSSGGTVIPVVKTISLAHLEGESVVGILDGAYHEAVTVTSGVATFTFYANKIHAGLPYTATCKLMKQEAGRIGGTDQGKRKKIFEMVLRVYKTLHMKVGPSLTNLKTIPFREVSDELDQVPSVKTDDYETKFPIDSSKKGGDVFIVHDQPLPATLLAVVTKMNVTQV